MKHLHWISPQYSRNCDALREEFGRELADALAPVTVDDFGGAYPWDAEIPPRRGWFQALREFRAHLEQEGWYAACACTPTPRSDGARLPDGTVLYGAEASALAVHAAARRGA